MPVKPLFRRNLQYVFVKPRRITSDVTMAVGDKVDKSIFKNSRLLHWHRMGFIGPEGHPWTESKLEAHRKKHNKQDVSEDVVKPPPKKKKRGRPPIKTDSLSELQKVMEEASEQES